MTGRVMGPASGSPATGTAHRQPVAHRPKLIAGMEGLTHLRRVARLRAQHGPGHGHAPAPVAHPPARGHSA